MAFNPLNWILGFFSLDIGIDLGTANTLVFVRGKGIVINEPSWVTVDRKTRRPIAVGEEAKEMAGRAPKNIIVVRPLRDGVIAEFEITEEMLAYFINKAHEQSIVPLPRPRVVIGVPTGVTEVEKRAVNDAALLAGAREVYLIEEPTASALAVGLPIDKVGGSVIVDIGGGTSEITVFSMGGVVANKSLRLAGDEMDRAVLQYIRTKYNVLIGERAAEQVKMKIGSAFPLPEEKVTSVRGRNLISGLPETLEISSIEIREALSPIIDSIVQAVKETVDEVPAEMIGDVMDAGICMSGGGALIRGLDQRISEDLRIHCWVADDPLTCVARGAGVVLEDIEAYRHHLLQLD
ncbi:MAG: rod shape-determining protein [Anaerolineales bacterium]|nr:rod shape-determining protein [Anaerolineales bacterium]MCW5854875.1 rod shape-determining protein [Anaerolineales bacterium]